MSRISLWGAVFAILFVTSTMLPAGIVSDVQVAGGYLYEVSTDRTVIYDLTVTPPEQVSVITYPESMNFFDEFVFAINAVVEKNRLYVYYYYEDQDSGIRIYNLKTPDSVQLEAILSLEGKNILGGMIANIDLLFHQSQPYGQFAALRDYLIFDTILYALNDCA